MKKDFTFLFAVLFLNAAMGQTSKVPVPTVIGPVTEPGTIFSASTVELSSYGYLEEEFFLIGNARRFDFDANPGFAVPVDSLYPYKTRIIVRRPVASEKFNGTVVVEWLNVSNMLDLDPGWYQSSEHLMRSGYAWVGVSVQRDGIHNQTGLRNWNPERYGSLDVTVDSALLQDQIGFDIFSQAIMALKSAQKIRPLGTFKPEIIIAMGYSQSALWLTGYHNYIQSLTKIIDGFMIIGAGEKLKTDIHGKVFKINSETDLILLGQVDSRQPDNEKIVTWEFSGTSHADKRFLDFYSASLKRDFGNFSPINCDLPLCSVIPIYYGYAAALDHMNQWIREEIAPPPGIQMPVLQAVPEVIIGRDTLGNAFGGIRLPQFDVPTGMNSGINTGQNWFCQFYGTHKTFDQRTLKSLYATHQEYMQKFTESVQRNLKDGYILEADTIRMLNEARELSYLWE
ncbi:MAG TPA: alpha/beta hydrolase domain-containing protein [Bacteroidales bacterium]|nr:alpha/beta hydrolase domain-containing protein [Bacteroidales bacterium]HRZ48058.1 alpha/beta hydrolase domain-containing protein [Bacteroidales bacterium]